MSVRVDLGGRRLLFRVHHKRSEAAEIFKTIDESGDSESSLTESDEFFREFVPL